jgi:phage terminase large subunit
MIKATTALNKICALKKRIWCLQGSQGAAKTYSACIIIIDLLAQEKNKEYYIVSSELSKMRDTVLKDCLNIIDQLGIKCKMTGIDFGSPKIVFPTGSFIRFIGLDKDDVGKGLRSDLVYVNEANKINFESYRELTSRAKRVIIDFNPNVEFWAHKEVIPRDDCDFLKLTFLDNEYLSKEETAEILRYKTKGYNDDGSIKSEYWANKWQVYGLGNTGGIEGVIFESFKEIDQVPEGARLLGHGMDFGYTNDPTAITSVYKYNDSIILDEEVYSTGLLNSDIIRLCKQRSIGTALYIYADAAEPKSIAEIKRAGIRVLPAKKGADSINFGIGLMQEQDIIITKRSKNIIKEFQSYTWAKTRTGERLNKPTDINNHAIDGIRYCIMELFGKPKGVYHVS